MLGRIWDQITVSTRASLTAPARPGLVDDEHRRLTEAVTDGDPQQAPPTRVNTFRPRCPFSPSKET